MRRTGVALLALFALVGGCSMERTLTEADSGSEVEVDSGDTIEVTLVSNASTGYRWVVAQGSLEHLMVFDERYEAPDTDLVGAPGQQVFVLRAEEEGAGILRLEYVRPFDDPVIPEKVVEFIVIIDDAEWPPRDGSPPGTSSASAPGTQP